MTISLKSDASGNSGAIQVAGVDRLTLNTDGSLVAGANPATGNRSMTLATMQKFADEFVASLAINGYQKLPSGLIIQWGITGALAAGQSTFVTFPISFPNAIWAIAPCALSTSNSNQYAPTVFGVTATSFNVGSIGSGYSGITWIAIGR